MREVASRWSDLKAIDFLFLHGSIVIGVLGSISFYTNAFIGSAQLTPTPEGYEPTEEEYEYHPITRFLIRNFYPTLQQMHEIHCHSVWMIWRKTFKKQLLIEVERQMMTEGDYASYYYDPTYAKYVRYTQQERKKDMNLQDSF